MIRRGLIKGIRASWDLLRLLAPVSIAVTILQHTPVLPALTRLFAPAMGWLGLSGDAAIVLVVGNFVGLYSALGAMASLSLPYKEIVILALMLSFSHNLLVETAVTRRLGIGFWRVIAYRVGLAIIAALIMNGAFLGWSAIVGAREPVLVEALVSDSAVVPSTVVDSAVVDRGEPIGPVIGKQPESDVGEVSGHAPMGSAAWFTTVLESSVSGLVNTVVLLIAILLPLMVFIEFLKEKQVLTKLADFAAPGMSKLGLSGKASFPLMAGIVFGIAYGAGVIIEAAREGDLTHSDRHLICVFLIACHAAIEDTLLFVPFGVNPLFLFVARFILAVALTATVARFSRLVSLRREH